MGDDPINFYRDGLLYFRNMVFPNIMIMTKQIQKQV